MMIFRNTIALILGLLIGAAVNMAIVTAGPSVIPPPEGVDVSSMESIRASIHLYQPKHFATPFLAHAVGTLVGSVVAFAIAASFNAIIAYIVGAVFFAGGIAASMMIPAPYWFVALDLLVAYIPMAWIGIVLGRKMGKKTMA